MKGNSPPSESAHVATVKNRFLQRIGIENTTEYAMILFFIGITGGALWLSFQFPSPADLFPKITSSIAFLSVFGIFGQKVKNDIIPDSMSDTSSEDETELKINEQFILGSSFVYAVLGILFGLVWVTPVFVLVYCKWNNWSWSRSVLFSLVSAGIPLFFSRYLAVDLMSGVV